MPTNGSSHERPNSVGEANPKRPRLLLDPPRPGGPGSSPASAASPSTLYPPSFAEIRAVTGDVAADELTGCDGWDPELHNATEEESELVEEYFEASWDENAEHAPENWPKLMPKQMLSSRDKEAPRRVPVLYNQGGSRFTAQAGMGETNQAGGTRVHDAFPVHPGVVCTGQHPCGNARLHGYCLEPRPGALHL